jgi:hypothetical protein
MYIRHPAKQSIFRIKIDLMVKLEKAFLLEKYEKIPPLSKIEIFLKVRLSNKNEASSS